MIRLIGILTGSALAIAFLLLLLGVPRLAETRVEVDSVAQVPEIVPVTETVAVAEPEPQADVPGEIVSIPEPEVTPDSEATPEPEAVVAIPAIAEPHATPQVAPLTPDVAERVTESAEQNWYAFWSPFRSEIAADGFVSELQRTTGLDYRVVKLQPGIYEVAFAYTDDADIREKLTRISAATGLDMSGG